MNIFVKLIFLVAALFFSMFSYANQEEMSDAEHNQWLKDKFSENHQALIPVVTVADMFFSCNLERKIDSNAYTIEELVLQLDRDLLAGKLTACLKNDSISSDNAINYGLEGCFHDQLSTLPKVEREQKMKLVLRAIASLSIEERLKSLTQCVTDQAFNYLPKKQ